MTKAKKIMLFFYGLSIVSNLVNSVASGIQIASTNDKTTKFWYINNMGMSLSFMAMMIYMISQLLEDKKEAPIVRRNESSERLSMHNYNSNVLVNMKVIEEKEENRTQENRCASPSNMV